MHITGSSMFGPCRTNGLVSPRTLVGRGVRWLRCVTSASSASRLSNAERGVRWFVPLGDEDHPFCALGRDIAFLCAASSRANSFWASAPRSARLSGLSGISSVSACTGSEWPMRVGMFEELGLEDTAAAIRKWTGRSFFFAVVEVSPGETAFRKSVFDKIVDTR